MRIGAAHPPGIRHADHAQQALDLGGGGLVRAMQLQRLADLLANAVHRIEGCAGLLKNIGHAAAPPAPELSLRQGEEILRPVTDGSADDARRRLGNQTGQGQGGHALPTAALPDQPHRFAPVDIKADALHGPGRLGPGAQMHLQIANLNKRFGGGHKDALGYAQSTCATQARVRGNKKPPALRQGAQR